jgi:hypothetical protein
VVALLLCIFLIGILIFLYLIVVKPEGTLMVTYSRTDTPPAAAAEAPGTLIERLALVDAVRAAGAISEAEYAAKRTAIIDEF